MGETDTLKKWINESNYIVFFGGAGVSTESKDFRSTDGLYHQEYDYPPETILSHSFYRKPEEFTGFTAIRCCSRMQSRTGRIWRWRSWSRKKAGGRTQNIDGLHQVAGGKEVLELHGWCSATIVRAAAGFTDWMIF